MFNSKMAHAQRSGSCCGLGRWQVAIEHASAEYGCEMLECLTRGGPRKQRSLLGED